MEDEEDEEGVNIEEEESFTLLHIDTQEVNAVYYTFTRQTPP